MDMSKRSNKNEAADRVENRIWQSKTKNRWRSEGESEEDIKEASKYFK